MPPTRQTNESRSSSGSASGSAPAELYPADQWMSGADAQAALGYGSRLKLYEAALSGDIGTVKIAGRRLFARRDVQKLAAKSAAA